MKTCMAARGLTRFYDDALKPVGLKVTQFSLLATIEQGQPKSISQLAQWLSIERTTLTRNLSLLENKGLVRLGPEGVRRARSMTVTVKGERILNRAMPLWQEAQQRVTSKLGDTEWDNTKIVLDQLSNVAVELGS